MKETATALDIAFFRSWNWNPLRVWRGNGAAASSAFSDDFRFGQFRVVGQMVTLTWSATT